MGSPFKMSGELISVEGAAPNGMRIRQLSDKLCQLQDELDTEKEVRGEAVELKLKVLDDKLIRAQITEEEKIKPLHDHVNSLTEELYAERLAREVMDESKSKEVKTVESRRSPHRLKKQLSLFVLILHERRSCV